ncbi:MAG: hypothetical protein KME13_17905 [Myxacorys californica WJT36-NPBG1]|jgi:hypothetical protein|nr:hypothetical protein [Myxacorys californica WJT36-NPBG1]
MAKSAVFERSEKLRLDAKYFCKAAVRARSYIEQRDIERLGEITSVLRKGIFDIKADTYTEPGDGVPFIRVGDIKNGLINENTTAWISDEANLKESATTLAKGDIVISKTAYPAAALITLPSCNVSQDTVAIKLSQHGRKLFHEEYIVAFLCSSLGMALMDAEFQGNVQEHLGLVDARKLPIPRLSLTFQDKVRNYFQKAIELRHLSFTHQSSAETYLADSIGLNEWSPPLPLAYTAKARLVRETGRLDSEYFAPRIKELIGILGREGLKIGDVAHVRREKFDSTIPGEFNYIEISDLTNEGTTTSIQMERSEAPSRAAWHVFSGDVITSTVRPIRRLSALIENHQEGFVCSSGFVVLCPKCVNPEVLLTYLRMPIFCELMDLHTSASMYPAISEKNLLTLPFSPPDSNTETAVCNAISNARIARRKADELLQTSKRAVEIAIEQSEAAAIQFLDEAED